MAQLGLTEDYLPFAVAVHLYSLELIGANADGSVYKVVNRTMRAPERQDLAAPGGVSADLECCLPYIKFLDEALARLP